MKRLTGTLSSIQDVSLSIEQEALQTFPCSEEGHDGSFACWAVARILGFPAHGDAMVRTVLTNLREQFSLIADLSSERPFLLSLVMGLEVLYGLFGEQI